MRFSAAVCAFGLLFLFKPFVVLGQVENANQLKNILKAAADIGAIQKEGGINGAMLVVKQCYDREMPSAKSLSRALEACMTQDMLVSMTAASVFKMNSPESLKKMGLPNPDAIRQGVTQRWLSIGKKFGLPLESVKAFSDLVNTKGLAEYSKVLTRVAANKY